MTSIWIKSCASDTSIDRLTGLGHGFPNAGNGQSIGLGYNAASQLTSETRSNDLYAWTASYNVTRAYAVNGLNQYESAGPAAFGYDANGNLTSDGASSYVYDAENRLVSASGATGASLAYDPLGRLFQTSGSSAGVTQFLYDGDALVAEYDGSNHLLRRYVHGPGVDEPLLWLEGAGTSSLRWLHADHQGSIIAASDASNNPVAVNSYDEYGIPGTQNQGRFQYTGQIWLPELAMYHYKARLYSPTLGRFLQTDPIGYKDQMNLYAYVGDDPVNKSDPSGSWSMSVHDKIFGWALGSTLTKDQLKVVQDASLRQDIIATFVPSLNNEHFLRVDGQSAKGAVVGYHSFVNDQLRWASILHAQGDNTRALIAFARAAHAIQDSHSPAHNRNGEPNTYHPTDHSPIDSVGKEGSGYLSREDAVKMISETRAAYARVFQNGENGRPAPKFDIDGTRITGERSCGSRTTQGPC